MECDITYFNILINEYKYIKIAEYSSTYILDILLYINKYILVYVNLRIQRYAFIYIFQYQKLNSVLLYLYTIIYLSVYDLRVHLSTRICVLDEELARAPVSSQELPEAPKSSQKLPRAPRSSQVLTGFHKSSPKYDKYDIFASLVGKSENVIVFGP